MNRSQRLMSGAAVRGRHWLMAILAFALALPLLAQTAAEKFRPRGDGNPVAGHYEVVLSGSEAGDDLPAIADELASAYGGRLEPFAEQGVRAFAIVLSPTRARMLSTDGRVSAVIELAGMPSETRASAASSPAAPSDAVGDKAIRPVVNGAGSWTTGAFAYDGAGNVKAIGPNVYVYDTASRLVSGTVEGLANRQDYSYDSFGNRTATARTGGGCVGGTDCEEVVTINSLTNRIASNGAQYDAAGDLTSFDSAYTYSYDGAGMLVREIAGGVDQQYLYTAADERIATIQGTGWTWTVRDLDGKVLRTFTSTNGNGTWGDTGFQWTEDYVWRDGLLLASESPSGTRHYHLDHLGTPRLVTDGAGVKIGLHSYYPFGAELAMSSAETPTELMKFTGHQRDVLAGDLHTLDYMHARHYSGSVGRFVSVDRIGGTPGHPQSWNRYAYGHNRPVMMIDPDGNFAFPWHIAITYVAARSEGLSVGSSISLAFGTGWVDFRRYSQSGDAQYTNMHAMIGRLPNGQRQTLAQARAGTAASIAHSLATRDLAAALHTTQDENVPLHLDHYWPGGIFGYSKLGRDGFAHFVRDLFPSATTVSNAYHATVSILEDAELNTPNEDESSSEGQGENMMSPFAWDQHAGLSMGFSFDGLVFLDGVQISSIGGPPRY